MSDNLVKIGVCWLVCSKVKARQKVLTLHIPKCIFMVSIIKKDFSMKMKKNSMFNLRTGEEMNLKIYK